MITSVYWQVRRFARRFWVRVTLISCLAILAAVLSPLSHFLPFSLKAEIDEESLDDLLSILTNSMLTVTTFSLSIMVSSHLAADGNATPRAHRLLREDGRTQTVIATFIGAFIYALTMTVMLNLGFFEQDNYGMIYLVTVGVLALLVVAMLRWVAHLAGLGSIEATIGRVEESAIASLKARCAYPFLGARPLSEAEIPEDAAVFHSKRFGYIQNIDTNRLNECASDWATRIFVSVSPGDWVGAGDPLGQVDLETLDEEQENAIYAAIAIGDQQDYDQDAIFSLVVLAEIAERALSPGINDPRTGIDVVSRLTRMIGEMPPERPIDPPTAPAVYCPPLDMRQMLLSTLDPIARDGRAFVEVQIAVQKAYALLSRHRDPDLAEAAVALSARALSYAREGIPVIEDLQRLAAVAPADYLAETTASEPSRRVSSLLGDERQMNIERSDG
ncbi:DUF2254 domain-containing protein [Palleronia sp. LCG004]|uniref:DUF2254 domain-containing protein n=1 Tax=Palleronia sp. LCG004 TaxID=3079304 RepID=UPI002942327C|nr:DUF2254 domain-containing protein [Palleronia sp. LCG004]WOI55785.1 DUF2254 domain-containing protein [Palleronia sp. LCG004]